MIDERRLERLINVGSFKWTVLRNRLLFVSVFACLIIFFSVELSGEEPTHNYPGIFNYLFLVVAFVSVSEVNMLMVRWLSRSSMLKGHLVTQMLVIVTATMLLAVFWVNAAMWFFGDKHLLSHKVMQLTLFFGILLMIIMHTMVMMSHISKAWLESRKELEKLKRAKLLSDYNSLQDRLNPHFLFNNLSVLRSLIKYNPSDAQKFIDNFTDVYRYLLRSHESQTVTVKNELEFLMAYIALHKERLGDGLQIAIEVGEEAKERLLPPMSIQLLVENAIKHNVASRHNPLHITIYTEQEDYLVVSNVINKRQTTYSTKTGIKTLKGQYKLIANKKIFVQELDGQYVVKIPLL